MDMWSTYDAHKVFAETRRRVRAHVVVIIIAVGKGMSLLIRTLTLKDIITVGHLFGLLPLMNWNRISLSLAVDDKIPSLKDSVLSIWFQNPFWTRYSTEKHDTWEDDRKEDKSKKKKHESRYRYRQESGKNVVTVKFQRKENVTSLACLAIFFPKKLNPDIQVRKTSQRHSKILFSPKNINSSPNDVIFSLIWRVLLAKWVQSVMLEEISVSDKQNITYPELSSLQWRMQEIPWNSWPDKCSYPSGLFGQSWSSQWRWSLPDSEFQSLGELSAGDRDSWTRLSWEESLLKSPNKGLMSSSLLSGLSRKERDLSPACLQGRRHVITRKKNRKQRRPAWMKCVRVE